MTQDTLFDFGVHFVKGKKNQGDDQPHLLFLDGHASRWNLEALCYLMGNKVSPFFLPSHTSVWAQPNNNGPNFCLHKCVESALSRLRGSSAKNTVWFYNTVIRHAWRDFVQREREELLNTGTNTTTSCWSKTGYYPFNPRPESWRHVLGTLGKQNKRVKRAEEKKEFEIEVKKVVDADSVLTKK